MTFSFQCECGRSLRIKPEQAGKRLRCPNAECGRIITVPHPASLPTESEPIARGKSSTSSRRVSSAFEVAPPALSFVPDGDAKPVETGNLENAVGRVHWNRFNVWTTLGLILLLTCVLSPIGIIFLVKGLRRALREELAELVERAKPERAFATKPTAQQWQRLVNLAGEHLSKPGEDKNSWHVGAAPWLEKARSTFVLAMDDGEEVLAMGAASGTAAGNAGVVVTDRAVYYRAFETPYQVRGLFALSNLASILGTMDNGLVFFMLRDGRVGHFRCDGFEGKRQDLVNFLTATTLLFDPSDSVAVVLPVERLLPETASPCQVPKECAGCFARPGTEAHTISHDLLIAARYLGVAHMTPETASATQKGIRIGGLLGGLSGAVIGAAVAHLWAKGRKQMPSLFTLALPVCPECATKTLARLHLAGPDGITVVFYNRSFADAFAAQNALQLSPKTSSAPLSGQSIEDKIHVQCPKCSKRMSVRKEYAGKRGKCPACDSAISIPAACEQSKALHVSTLRPSPSKEVIGCVPGQVARDYLVFPLSKEKGRLRLLASSCENDKKKQLAFILNCEVELKLAESQEIRELIDRHYG